MKQLFTLQNVYKISGHAAIYLGAVGLLCLGYGLCNGLFLAPADYVQKDAARIMYVHVPCAILSLSIYTIIGISSLIYLVWKTKLADIMAKVSASFGAMLTFLALVTGSLWGKPMWGTWWVWDARLTSELILFFLYLGYMGLRDAIPDQKVAATLCAVLAVIGLLDIPIIHFSVEWWNTLHQTASISKFAKPSIDPAMLYPLLSVIVAMYMLYLAVTCINIRSEILWRERKAKWVHKLLLRERVINV